MRWLELLETRRLLSASVSGGVLTVNGTARKDVIELLPTEVYSASAGHLVAAVKAVLNGESQGLFADSTFSSIDIFAGAGNDLVSVAYTRKVHGKWIDGLSIPCSIEGSAGNDSLIGGDGADTLVGGNGRDLLQGNAGDDLLSGGASADTLWGGLGNDSLYGNNGNDQLRDSDITTDGNDNPRDSDLLSGGPGIDTVSFASIPDVRFPGRGIDTKAAILVSFNGRADDGLYENFNAPGGRILYQDDDNIDKDVEQVIKPAWAT